MYLLLQIVCKKNHNSWETGLDTNLSAFSFRQTDENDDSINWIWCRNVTTFKTFTKLFETDIFYQLSKYKFRKIQLLETEAWPFYSNVHNIPEQRIWPVKCRSNTFVSVCSLESIHACIFSQSSQRNAYCQWQNVTLLNNWFEQLWHKETIIFCPSQRN